MSLQHLSAKQMRQLRDALTRGRVSSPITRRGLGAAGLGRFQDDLELLYGLDAERAAALLGAFVAEREARPKPAELVWTGPEEGATTTARDTEVVLRRLLGEATREVIVGGYSFDDGEHILKPLHDRMKDHGVQATFFLNLKDRARVKAEQTRYADRQVQAFLSKNWPFEAPYPVIYYDPRTVSPDVYASMHAKCVVVDEEQTLVTSANFTSRGQTRNVEVGVLLHDRAFAKQLAEQWRGLIRGGHVVRYGE